MSQSLVSYFTSPLDRNPIAVPLGMVLSDFKCGRYASQIKRVRTILEESGTDAYRVAKKSLPAVAFCGEFIGGHAKSNLVHSNGLLVFDIDHLSNNEMVTARRKMINDQMIMAFWVSPSGNGYKGLIQLSYLNVPEDLSLDHCYKKAFEDVLEYFHGQLEIDLDVSCSDYSRICYVCWDEDLYYNEHANLFSVDCSQISNQRKNIIDVVALKPSTGVSKVFKPVNVPGKNSQRSRRIVGSIIKFLSKRNLSITSTYDEWLRVGFAIASTFNYDLGQKYFLDLSRLDRGKFDEETCIRKLQECYMTGNGDITLGTIIEMAKKKGYEYKGSSEDS